MKAIILNLSAWAVLPFMDTIAKFLSSEISFFQITWARYFFTVFWTLPFMFFFFRKDLKWSENPKLQILRGITLLLANVCFFYSISIISMAKALTLAFVAPLVTTALSPIFLNEKVGIRRWPAILLLTGRTSTTRRPGSSAYARRRRRPWPTSPLECRARRAGGPWSTTRLWTTSCSRCTTRTCSSSLYDSRLLTSKESGCAE